MIEQDIICAKQLKAISDSRNAQQTVVATGTAALTSSPPIMTIAVCVHALFLKD